MAYQCEICGKKPAAGKNVSHSNRRTNRYFRPNLTERLVYFGDTPRRVYVCGNCVKSGRAATSPQNF
ncbi:MAG: 50S ribosomal protein L28 [Elusimicrobia bacterium]|nr:50S ribosomal protein L28 [Elusimicrobiota bacterium]